MRPSSRWDERDGRERGSAALEFLLAGLLLIVPLAYLVLALGQVQEQTLGAEATARHAANVLARGDGPTPATYAALQDVLARVPADYGIAPETMTLHVECPGAHGTCPEAGANVAVTVRVAVPLPFLPPVLGLDHLASVPVEATSLQKASRYGVQP